jgi:hypothetical protein
VNQTLEPAGGMQFQLLEKQFSPGSTSAALRMNLRTTRNASFIISGFSSSIRTKCWGEKTATPTYRSRGRMLGTRVALPFRILPSGTNSTGNRGVKFSMFSLQKGQNIPSERLKVSSIFGLFGDQRQPYRINHPFSTLLQVKSDLAEGLLQSTDYTTSVVELLQFRSARWYKTYEN